MLFEVDIDSKTLIKLNSTSFSHNRLRERYDIQEWIEKTPEILGNNLLIIGKELELKTGIRLDLLAIDKASKLVVIELKRDDSGSDVTWQAIKYASHVSNFLQEDIIRLYSQYLKKDEDDAQAAIEEFIDDNDLENLNSSQRIILVSKDYHPDAVSAVLWLRDQGINIECVKLQPYVDQNNRLFVTPNLIIPLPEAKDYIQKKETKVKQDKTQRSIISSFSLEKSNYLPEHLKEEVLKTLRSNKPIIPMFVTFLEIVLSKTEKFKREEIKARLYENNIGQDVGQAGRYLSNISQFLTKKPYPHLRQIIEFNTGGATGEIKDNYYVLPEYRDLLMEVLDEYKKERNSIETIISEDYNPDFDEALSSIDQPV